MRNFITIRHRIKKFGNKYFLTNDTGRYCTLTEEEYKFFRKDCFTKESEEKLKASYMVLDASNIPQALDLLNRRNNVIFAGTSLHIIVVTLRCNMSCLYCQVGRKFCDKEGYDMDEETAKHTVDRIFETTNSTINIEFQGGEPTLNWDVLKFIIEYSEKKNKEIKKEVVISMVTNMTTMDDEKMKYLIDHKVDVCTSLDGPANVHNHNRKYDHDNHALVLEWIAKFNEEFKRRKLPSRMSALVTLTNYSLKYGKEIIDQYMKLGIEVVHLRKLTKLGFAKLTWDKISYTADEYLTFWKEMVEYIEELKTKGKFMNERMLLIMESKIRDDQDQRYFDLCSPCGAGIGQLAYNYDGDVYSCDEGRMMKKDIFKLGNVKDNVYEDFARGEKCFNCVQMSTNTQYDECDNCVYSPYCGLCPVLNYDEFGTTKIDVVNSDWCKIHKFQFDKVVEMYFLK